MYCCGGRLLIIWAHLMTHKYSFPTSSCLVGKPIIKKGYRFTDGIGLGWLGHATGFTWSRDVWLTAWHLLYEECSHKEESMMSENMAEQMSIYVYCKSKDWFCLKNKNGVFSGTPPKMRPWQLEMRRKCDSTCGNAGAVCGPTCVVAKESVEVCASLSKYIDILLHGLMRFWKNLSHLDLDGAITPLKVPLIHCMLCISKGLIQIQRNKLFWSKFNKYCMSNI